MTVKPKKNYQAEEIGKLRVALEYARNSRDHYFNLVGERTKQLQRKAKECRQLRTALKKIEGFGYGPDVVVARIALDSQSAKT